MAGLLPPVVQDFSISAAQFIAGVQEMLAGTERLAAGIDLVITSDGSPVPPMWRPNVPGLAVAMIHEAVDGVGVSSGGRRRGHGPASTA